jgi:hypothetical protein
MKYVTYSHSFHWSHALWSLAFGFLLFLLTPRKTKPLRSLYVPSILFVSISRHTHCFSSVFMPSHHSFFLLVGNGSVLNSVPFLSLYPFLAPTTDPFTS